MTRTQRIVIWVATLIGLLVAWKVFGQGFGSFNHDLPYLVPSHATNPPSPTSIPGLAFRWVASDLTNGAVVAWIDRVQGKPLYPYVSAPEKTSNYVAFDADILTNATTIFNSGGGTNSLTMVCIYNNTNQAGDQVLWVSPGSAEGILLNYSGAGTVRWYVSAVLATLAANQIHDLIIGGAGTNVTALTFTNGVLASVNGEFSPFNVSWFGSSNNGPGNSFKGLVYELLVYTNTFTSAYAEIIYQYRTNTYGL